MHGARSAQASQERDNRGTGRWPAKGQWKAKGIRRSQGGAPPVALEEAGEVVPRGDGALISAVAGALDILGCTAVRSGM